MTSKVSVQTTIDIAAIVNQQRQAAAGGPGSEASRAELISALQSAYLAQGVTDVTDDMIEKAVDTYYAERLQFKGFQGGFFAKTAAAIYLQIATHRAVAAGLLVVALGVGLGYTHIRDGIVESRNKGIVEQFTTLQQDMKRINEEAPRSLAKREGWLVNAKNNVPVLAQKNYNAYLDTYSQRLKDSYDGYQKINNQVGKDIPHPSLKEVAASPTKFDKQARDLKAYSIALQASFMMFSEELDGLERSAESLRLAEKSYNDAIVDKDYLSVKSDEKVEQARMAVERALESGSPNNVKLRLAQLEPVVGKAVKHKALVDEAARLEQKYSGVFNYPESKSVSSALIQEAKFAAEKDDAVTISAMAKQLDVLKDQEAQAALDLVIRVVDKPGIRSGTSRYLDDKSQKRWYLIMEAINRAGIPQKRLIYNQETKKREVVSYWGQEVSKETFDKVAADKKGDDIIDEPLFGRKPAGVYAPIFDRAVLKGTITSW